LAREMASFRRRRLASRLVGGAGMIVIAHFALNADKGLGALLQPLGVYVAVAVPLLFLLEWVRSRELRNRPR
jgi:hypothetical protein